MCPVTHMGGTTSNDTPKSAHQGLFIRATWGSLSYGIPGKRYRRQRWNCYSHGTRYSGLGVRWCIIEPGESLRVLFIAGERLKTLMDISVIPKTFRRGQVPIEGKMKGPCEKVQCPKRFNDQGKLRTPFEILGQPPRNLTLSLESHAFGNL